MKVKELMEALERFAPLPLQESYDNAGLQLGLIEADVSRVLLCLDVTERVIEEAVEKGCQLIVSHHPLLFHGVKCISDYTYVQNCIRLAVKHDIAIYSAHTNLDNAKNGVNWEIAQRLGLKDITFLVPNKEATGGSGIIGICEPMAKTEMFHLIKSQFGVQKMLCNNGPESIIKRVAICGGAGAFLVDDAVRSQADLFITGEMGYHHFFGYEHKINIAVLGHYESEQYTINLLEKILQSTFPTLELIKTTINTNPIKYF